MSTLIFRKIVDQSLLNAGLTVPTESHAKLLDGLGILLSKGDKHSIKIEG